MRRLAEVSVEGQQARLAPFVAGEVTSSTFVAKALEFMRRSGRANGEHLVLRHGDSRFDEWLAFMRQLGLKTSYANCSGVLTVPTSWPWEFSLDAAKPRTRTWHAD